MTDAVLARPVIIASLPVSRVVVISNLFVTLVWRAGEQRGRG